MEDREPGAGELPPAEPTLCQLGQFRRVGEPSLKGLMSEIRSTQPFCPRIGPPCRRTARSSPQCANGANAGPSRGVHANRPRAKGSA
jgi:hypothetical protein